MPLVVRLERSNVIQMDHLVGSTCKWVRLDRDAQMVHHLTARALPNELCDHPVCDRVSVISESLLTHVESMMAYLCVVDLRYDIEDLGRNME